MLALPGAGLCANEAQTSAQIQALVRDAYFYAYPLVSMDTTMRQATNVPDATPSTCALP
jgi:hypothetical protein